LIDIEKEANEEKDTLDVDLRQKKYRKWSDEKEQKMNEIVIYTKREGDWGDVYEGSRNISALMTIFYIAVTDLAHYILTERSDAFSKWTCKNFVVVQETKMVGNCSSLVLPFSINSNWLMNMLTLVSVIRNAGSSL
jgi:hypothetical protein